MWSFYPDSCRPTSSPGLQSSLIFHSGFHTPCGLRIWFFPDGQEPHFGTASCIRVTSWVAGMAHRGTVRDEPAEIALGAFGHCKLLVHPSWRPGACCTSSFADKVLSLHDSCLHACISCIRTVPGFVAYLSFGHLHDRVPDLALESRVLSWRLRKNHCIHVADPDAFRRRICQAEQFWHVQCR